MTSPPWQPKAILRLLLLALLLLTLGVLYGPALIDLVRDRARVEAWLAAFGPWGPLALILLNTLQIVIAPIPGYFVQAAAGYLFGTLAGGIYGTIGMVTGGALAMNLPWFILLLGPVGDIPYFIAGLTHVPTWKILLIALVLRAPSVFVAAAVGAGVIVLPPAWWLAFGAILVVIASLLHRYRERLEHWMDHLLLRRVA